MGAAAPGSRRVGAIDAAIHQQFHEAFSDPCVTPGAVWRALTGSMVAAIVLRTFAAVCTALVRGATMIPALLLLFGRVCLVATDVPEASPRSARRGAWGATTLLGVGFFLAGMGLVLVETMRLRDDDAIDELLVASVLAWGLAGWRWGNPVSAALSGVALFGYLGRLLWLLAGAVLTGVAGAGRWAVRSSPRDRGDRAHRNRGQRPVCGRQRAHSSRGASSTSSGLPERRGVAA